MSYQKILNACLNALNFNNLRTFDTCEECIDSREIPDIVILDHKTKEYHLSGLDFLIRYRQNYSETHFLFLSSDANVEVAVNTIKWGASDYIIKSRKGLEQLVLKINLLINSYKKIKRNRIEWIASLVLLGMFSLVFLSAILLYNSQII